MQREGLNLSGGSAAVRMKPSLRSPKQSQKQFQQQQQQQLAVFEDDLTARQQKTAPQGATSAHYTA